MRGGAALPQLLLPRLAGLRLLPRLWPVLVGALHIPSTQVTVSRNAAAEQSASAALLHVTHVQGAVTGLRRCGLCWDADWQARGLLYAGRYRFEGHADKCVQYCPQ